MTALRRFASSPLEGGRTLWPGQAGSTVALVDYPSPFALRDLDL